MTLKTRTNTKLLSIKNCRLILENRILDDATIVIEDGILTSISTTGAAPDGAIDAYGCFVMAGLVDSHSDGLEKEISPRPTVRFDTTYALSSYESRVRSAGITTIAHGVGYQDNPKMGRSVEGAKELRQVILSRASNPDSLVSHKVLHRIEARDEAGVEALVQGLNSETGEMTDIEGDNWIGTLGTFPRIREPNKLISDEEFVNQIEKKISETGLWPWEGQGFFGGKNKKKTIKKRPQRKGTRRR